MRMFETANNYCLRFHPHTKRLVDSRDYGEAWAKNKHDFPLLINVIHVIFDTQHVLRRVLLKSNFDVRWSRFFGQLDKLKPTD